MNKSEKLELIEAEIKSLSDLKKRIEREPIKTYTDTARMVDAMGNCLNNIARICADSF